MGAAAGAALTLVLLDTSLFPVDLGWRLAFGLGALMGLGIMLVRRNVPESPRWLMIHGREEHAERLVGSIEQRVERETDTVELEEPDDEIEIEQRKSTSIAEVARTLVARYPRRSALGFTLMATQAFIYNAVIFTFTIVLTTFFKISDSAAPAYLIPFGIANFLGALLLGRLFDTIGRRAMISSTYFISAVGLFVLGLLFNNGTLGLGGFVAVLCATFFFASAAASAGYLTVSEVFPLETRAMAIALFYAVATGIGGAVGPLLFGSLLGTGDKSSLFLGYVIGAVLMLIAAVVALVWGVDAEQESLEEVAEPLSAES
jgi:MFS family permease